MRVAVVMGNPINLIEPTVIKLLSQDYLVFALLDKSSVILTSSVNLHVVSDTEDGIGSWERLRALLVHNCMVRGLEPAVDLMINFSDIGKKSYMDLLAELANDYIHLDLMNMIIGVEVMSTYLDRSSFARVLNIYPSYYSKDKKQPSISEVTMDLMTRDLAKQISSDKLFVNGLSYLYNKPDLVYMNRAISRIREDVSNNGILFELDSDGWVLPNSEQYTEEEYNEQLY